MEFAFPWPVTQGEWLAWSSAAATMSGFYLGVGLCCILLAQPLLYMALGFSWLFTAFGRLVSILSDRGNTLYNWVFVLIDLALALLPLGFVFGFMP
jgi:hypothetical protein